MTPVGAEQNAMQALSSGERRQVLALLSRLTAGLKSILRDQLVGIYLYGSLVTGDFDFDLSDIDLVVVLENPLDGRLFTALQQFHAQLLREFPAWDDRLELAYISAGALRSFRTRTSAIGIMSPGEPFHLVQAGDDWLISWYALREKGIALQGPPIEALINPLPLEAWLKAVREHICAYRESVKTALDKPFLSYIVLTVARGLFTLAHRRDASKIQAANWLASACPHWADLIERALQYRHNPAADTLSAGQLRPEVERFLADVLEQEICDEANSTA